MSHTTLFEQKNHWNILLDEQDLGEAVQANHHVIVHEGKGIILDPGGHKAYRKALGDTMAQLRGGKLEYIFLSHQDPDIVAVASDQRPLADRPGDPVWLDLNDTETIVRFILDTLQLATLQPGGNRHALL